MGDSEVSDQTMDKKMMVMYFQFKSTFSNETIPFKLKELKLNDKHFNLH